MVRRIAMALLGGVVGTLVGAFLGVLGTTYTFSHQDVWHCRLKGVTNHYTSIGKPGFCVEPAVPHPAVVIGLGLTVGALFAALYITALLHAPSGASHEAAPTR